MKARNVGINEPVVTHTMLQAEQSCMASTTQTPSAVPQVRLPNQQPPAFQLASGPNYTMQPLPAFATSRSITSRPINMQYQQTLWSFNGSGVPSLPVPLQHANPPLVPTHSPAIANVGSLHQMSDGTIRTSSGSEASSSGGTGPVGNYPETSGAA
jgi:hypothetical protein